MAADLIDSPEGALFCCSGHSGISSTALGLHNTSSHQSSAISTLPALFR